MSGEYKKIDCEVSKVDSKVGVVFGYAIVSTQYGKAYFDSQEDHIPVDSMLKAATNYMKGERIAKDMHSGKSIGMMVFGMPITNDIAKSLGISIQKEGFVVGFKPKDDKVLKSFLNGTRTGFSIGGKRIKDVEVD